MALVSFCLTTETAEAQGAKVIQQLQDFGGLSRREARSLTSKISKRMKGAANSIIGLNDPVRRAMRLSIFGNQPMNPQQQAASDARARLYLYAGLTPQTLSILFKPGSTSVLSCIQVFQVTQKHCEALFAASTSRPVDEVRLLSQRSPPTAPTAGANIPTVQPVSRATQTQQISTTPRPQTTIQATSSPAMVPAQPTPTRPTASAAPNSALSTAAAYKARREKYLAKFKIKKAKQNKAPPKQNKVAVNRSDKAASPSSPTASTPMVFDNKTQTTKDTSAAPPTAAPSEAKVEESKKKSKEPDSFIADLLSDPLGNNK